MTAIVKSQPAQMGIVLRPTTFAELAQFAQMAAKSAMVPSSFRGKPEDVMLAVQMGSELNLAPMQALQNIAVINGRPSLWGDAVLALIKAHPDFVSCEEAATGDGDTRAATCRITRRGEPPVVRTFSVADAKTAQLWGKAGPWQSYPARMLQMRARGFAARDAFPDALRGLVTVEESRDETPEPAFTGETIEGQVETVQTPEPKRQTVREFLDALEADCLAAQDGEEVDAIVARPDVQRALDTLQNGARDRLNAMVAAAIARTAGEVSNEGHNPG